MVPTRHALSYSFIKICLRQSVPSLSPTPMGLQSHRSYARTVESKITVLGATLPTTPSPLGQCSTSSPASHICTPHPSVPRCLWHRSCSCSFALTQAHEEGARPSWFCLPSIATNLGLTCTFTQHLLGRELPQDQALRIRTRSTAPGRNSDPQSAQEVKLQARSMRISSPVQVNGQ